MLTNALDAIQKVIDQLGDNKTEWRNGAILAYNAVAALLHGVPGDHTWRGNISDPAYNPLWDSTARAKGVEP